MNPLLLLLLPAALYIYIKKPNILAIVFFTITIANINFNISGLPLNIRALLGIALLARVFFEEGSIPKSTYIFSDARFVLFFILYTLVITEFYELFTFEFLKTSALTLICSFLGFYYYFKKENTFYIKLSLILAGIICFIDLAYTYIFIGNFPVQRVYTFLLNIPVEYDDKGDVYELVNWNFYGLICGTCFVFILNDFLNNKLLHKYLTFLLPVMFLGVLMSTSRSTLLGLICASLFLIFRELKNREQSRKALKLLLISSSVLFLSLLAFTYLKDHLDLDFEFVEKITKRLIDEPIAVFNKQMGLAYKIESLDAMEWRKDASADAFTAFLDLNFIEQLFGIGFWGFATRDLGNTGLPPHNGFLMLLIEYGMFGFVFYIIFTGSQIIKSLKENSSISSLVIILIFTIFYCVGQNEELTSSITFLFITSLVAENRLQKNST